MSATASYVLVADYFYRDDADGERITHRRGDTISLSDKEARNLLRVGAVAKKSDDAAKAAVANPGAEPVQPGSVVPDGFNQSTFGVAAANSGLAPEDASGGAMSEEQLTEARVAAGDEPPPRAATADVWRNWAIRTGKLSADEAEQTNKADLQALAK